MGNPIFMLIWLLILIFISFFVAFFCAGWYIFVHCLTVCIPPLQDFADLLLKGVQLPRYCADKMVSGAPIP